MSKIVLLSYLFKAFLGISQFLVLGFSHLLHSVSKKHGFLVHLSTLQMLLGLMLVYLSIQIALIISLSNFLLLTLFLTLNLEFLCLILDKEFPNVKLLAISTKLRAISLVKSICGSRLEDIVTTAGLNWCLIGPASINSWTNKSIQSVGSGGSGQI